MNPAFSESNKIILRFQALADISLFKHECACTDFYIDRDALTLVGTFSTAQLRLATTKYAAEQSPTNDNSA